MRRQKKIISMKWMQYIELFYLLSNTHPMHNQIERKNETVKELIYVQLRKSKMNFISLFEMLDCIFQAY